MAALVAARGNTLTLPLTGNGAKKGSTLTVTSEEMALCKGQAVLTFKGVKLANRDGWFGKSDPFWRLSKMTETGGFVPVARSAVVMNNRAHPARFPRPALALADQGSFRCARSESGVAACEVRGAAHVQRRHEPPAASGGAGLRQG